ncbi:MAG TPA: ATP-dependent sacrificial sulfur transferase LarE [Dehalococcoidia bacterium]|nr:ATP-dependent sacrificial sulfur transferase LarE [Dehalococcoidia bacterium]
MTPREQILEAMRERRRLLILYSGGLDSTLLAKLAHDALGSNAATLTIDSALIPRSEISSSKTFAEEIGIDQNIVHPMELEEEHFRMNPPDRCYLCRKARDAVAWQWAREHEFEHIADGLSYSDLSDYRPGLRASTEDRIWHPFIEFKLGKGEIRRLSRELGLSGWDRPSMACLASRFPHGFGIDPVRVDRVDRAEEYLRGLGFTCVRVRHFPYNLAFVEVDDISRAVRMKDEIVARLRELGFAFVSVDLEQFASGKMNRTAVTPAHG